MKAATVTKEDLPTRKPSVIDRANFLEAEHEAAVWRATLDPGAPYEDALNSSFWAPVARLMHLHDEIKLRNAEGTLFAWLLVTSCDPSRGFVEVIELLKKDLSPSEAEPYSFNDMIGRWEGPITRWVVRRQPDNVVIGRGIPNRTELIRRMHTDFTQHVIA
ncbi:hypothetical protein [Bradyrhizobium ottawaense]|uniref:hypothetical protein n=1 Tax=Bradyrhizobium ottawaense TaxID=931866 RepID=UPI001BAA97E0|nr:hypothetical protein [Bradyrhizobium ottawaense]MBR1362938.1 hypothetical protein [Bradyrhizobium ottawaense]